MTSSGVSEELVLNSANTPTSFTFHLADPHKQLGALTAAPDGGYVFTTLFDGAVQLEIAPAFAYQPVSGVRPLVPDRGSAHLSVVAAGDGFDITESVDAAWLAGKSFPVILDPTLNFNDAYGMYALSVNVTNGCGGCNTVFMQNTPVGVGSFDYGSSGNYQPMRSHFWWNLAPLHVQRQHKISARTYDPEHLANELSTPPVSAAAVTVRTGGTSLSSHHRAFGRCHLGMARCPWGRPVAN